MSRDAGEPPPCTAPAPKGQGGKGCLALEGPKKKIRKRQLHRAFTVGCELDSGQAPPCVREAGEEWESKTGGTAETPSAMTQSVSSQHSDMGKR